MNFNYFSSILQNNTFSGLIVGQNIVALQQVDSTNNYLKNKLAKSAPVPEGTVIMAEEQFAGRGQHENNWVTEPGRNLTFSVLLCPVFLDPRQQFKLNIAVSLAIRDALEPILGDKLKIKWPNDIYFGDAKLGGILIENIVRGSLWKYSVAGIGINVNQTSFPANLKAVTSLKDVLTTDYDKYELLNNICRQLSLRYEELKNGAVQHMAEYQASLFRFNEDHLFEIEGIVRSGRIVDVVDDGRIRIETEGQAHLYAFREISFVISGN